MYPLRNFLISLADAYGCKIVLNAGTALGKPQNNNQQPQTIYSCTPGSSSTQYEVHVLSVYEGSSHTRPPTAGDTPVNIVGNSNRPIILVLGSYEPVNWILKLPAGITISKVILVSKQPDHFGWKGLMIVRIAVITISTIQEEHAHAHTKIIKH